MVFHWAVRVQNTRTQARDYCGMRGESSPKLTPQAYERTFLSWIKFALYLILAGASIAPISAKTGEYEGIISTRLTVATTTFLFLASFSAAIAGLAQYVNALRRFDYGHIHVQTSFMQYMLWTVTVGLVLSGFVG